jgi:hydroxyethylthiazole kinase-like uncharacterized protein yjeF
MGAAVEQWKIWSASEARRFIHAPKPEDDKYSRGVLGVIAGSRQYPGAAILVCKSALHTGIGMLRFSAPRAVRSLVLRSAPEVVTRDGKVQAWVIGPGLDPDHLGRGRKKDISQALAQKIPCLIDAGALALFTASTSPVLITPHFRELSRTLARAGVSVTPEEIQEDPKKWAVRASQELGVAVLLKGSVTVVASASKRYELPLSTPWLATAGSGDVLAGIIGALLATNSLALRNDPTSIAEIAATGALIHARAAERASVGGPISATDIIEMIPRTIAEMLL